MKISSEFSRYADSYQTYNIIQDKVVKKLVGSIDSKPQRILDIGCGSGAVCKNIDWEYEQFVGLDFAPRMLELHPKDSKIECKYGNFNDDGFLEELESYDFDYIVSASSLQWAKDLDNVLKQIASLDLPVSMAIFTSGTFETLYKTANLEPLLRSADALKWLVEKYFDAKMEVVKYTLEFDSTREMFRYIKKSGVSGSRNVLSFKETKKLMNEYPLDYLEFEVLFITAS